jgi:hypothetical protein
MEIPIDDALTVAFVDVVHALSELTHLDWSGPIWETKDEVTEAVADLRNAIGIMKPHVKTACLDCFKRKDEPGVPGICAAWHNG